MKRNIFTTPDGFSLLEITVVLIIMSILLSAVIPVMSRAYLENAANKTAQDILAIQDAARKFYLDNNQWPDTSVYPTALAALQAGHYLPSAWNGTNPFGASAQNPSDYVYSVSGSGSQLSVSTTVPSDARPILQNLLPLTSVAGNILTSSVPVPGASVNGFGLWQAISFNTVYQAASDGFVAGSVYLQAGISGTQSASAEFYTSPIDPPTSNPRAAIEIYNMVAAGSTTRGMFPFCFPVRKGDYYELALTNGYASGVTLEFIPLG